MKIEENKIDAVAENAVPSHGSSLVAATAMLLHVESIELARLVKLEEARQRLACRPFCTPDAESSQAASRPRPCHAMIRGMLLRRIGAWTGRPAGAESPKALPCPLPLASSTPPAGWCALRGVHGCDSARATETTRGRPVAVAACAEHGEARWSPATARLPG